MNETLVRNSKEIDDAIAFVNKVNYPTLLMQGDPRQVVTANKKACTLFGKNLSQIEGQRGGQVFDCIHAFTEAGCGQDVNCENCKIKTAVVETFTTGKAYSAQTILNIKKHKKIAPYVIEISTEKEGNFALMKIVKFEE